MKKLLAPKLVQLLDLLHAINSLKLLVSMHTSFFSFRKFSFNNKDILSEVNSVNKMRNLHSPARIIYP